MSRLTKTFKNGECHTLRTCCAPYYKKLSQLEDIEDEIGIDLATLIKALKNGIWYKEEYIEFIAPHRLVFDIDYLYEVDTGHSAKLINHFHFKDYGKNWALTKEELL